MSLALEYEHTSFFHMYKCNKFTLASISKPVSNENMYKSILLSVGLDNVAKQDCGVKHGGLWKRHSTNCLRHFVFCVTCCLVYPLTIRKVLNEPLEGLSFPVAYVIIVHRRQIVTS